MRSPKCLFHSSIAGGSRPPSRAVAEPKQNNSRCGRPCAMGCVPLGNGDDWKIQVTPEPVHVTAARPPHANFATQSIVSRKGVRVSISVPQVEALALAVVLSGPMFARGYATVTD